VVGSFLFGIALGGVCDEILKADELRCVLGRFDVGDSMVEGFSVAARFGMVKSGLAGLPFGVAAETLAGTANSTAATKDVRDLRVMN